MAFKYVILFAALFVAVLAATEEQNESLETAAGGNLGYAGLGYYGGHGLGYAGHGVGYAGHGVGYAGHGLGYAGHGLGYAGHGLGYASHGSGYAGHGLGYAAYPAAYGYSGYSRGLHQPYGGHLGYSHLG